MHRSVVVVVVVCGGGLHFRLTASLMSREGGLNSATASSGTLARAKEEKECVSIFESAFVPTQDNPPTNKTKTSRVDGVWSGTAKDYVDLARTAGISVCIDADIYWNSPD